jgi:DNA-binding PadR family transcriptional regulator
MPIQHAVLALLAHGESHGYEIKASFEDAVGPQWGELNIGHLYQVLDRCVRDGLVTRRHVVQVNRPDKTVYRLTGEGERELERWLDAPFVRQSGYRDDFFLKLLAASRFGADQLAHVLAVQREAYLGELASLGELRARHRDKPLVGLLIEAASLHTEANLRIVEQAEAARDELVAAAEARPPAATDELADTAG